MEKVVPLLYIWPWYYPIGALCVLESIGVAGLLFSLRAHIVGSIGTIVIDFYPASLDTELGHLFVCHPCVWC